MISLKFGLFYKGGQIFADFPFDSSREAGVQEGPPVGISSGAALRAAAETAGRPEHKGEAVLVIPPDAGGRYLAARLFPKEQP
ncbi:MAG: hypothetical protein LBO05_05160 [Deltaproteobacteria bacterium]|jgi:cysteine synthase A|nr:hypothetical protein [Deltaproteobacteria bacterium]